MKSAKFILIDTGSESNRIMMSDVGMMENGIQRSKTYETGSRILDSLIRLHFSYAITQKVNLPGKSIWDRYCVLDKLTGDDGYEYFIVIVNNAIHNIHIFSLILDPFEHLPVNVQKQLNAVNWDRVFSFQKSDCEKYGFEFTDKIYSKVDIEKYAVPSDPKSDVYFIGLAKDRMDKIYTIYKELTDAGCKCDFTVIIGKRKLAEYQTKYPGISFQTNRVPYTEVLRRIAATKCILEFCAEGQDGLTMRFYEAVFYNKLLITNNQTAIASELYNPNYMKIINESDDFNIGWILNEVKVNYYYNYEYSPLRFLSDLAK